MMRFPLLLAILFLSHGVLVQADETTMSGVASCEIPGTLWDHDDAGNEQLLGAERDTQQQRLRALVIGTADQPALLVTCPDMGLSPAELEAIAARLVSRTSIPRERIAICLGAPGVKARLPDGLRDERARTIGGLLEKVVDQALAQRRSAQLAWSRHTVQVEADDPPLRAADSPLQVNLTQMRVTDDAGRITAVVVSASAGQAATLDMVAESIEARDRGVTALVILASSPTASVDRVQQQRVGTGIAAAASRHLTGVMRPLPATIRARFERIELPLRTTPAEAAQWDRPVYPIQTWCFASELAMVFLGGELAADYASRFEDELDIGKVSMNRFANDASTVLPSRRELLRQPSSSVAASPPVAGHRLAVETEELIVQSVARLLPAEFFSEARQREFPPPRSPQDSAAAIQLPEGFEIELMACEPLVVDPVAIDFAADGKLWVAEMRDYPSGIDGRGAAGGCIKFLEDVDRDGRIDKATTFLEQVPFPTGVMAWGQGVLVCAMSEIIYAEDQDGDGRADVRQVLLSGFSMEHSQGLVNGLSLGLDNWIHGAGGVGRDKVVATASGKQLSLNGEDFRFTPDMHNLAALGGISQQGRVRDDWGNWFGCTNSRPLLHFPLPADHRQRVSLPRTPRPTVVVVDGEDKRVYPASRSLTRYNGPDSANQFVSACGIGIYRDVALGEDFYGNVFTCEPAHNLISRRLLQSEGTTFIGLRHADEQQSEFVRSSDHWFRPVQVRTGTDGALWVADMYRFVVELPERIAPLTLAGLDVRGGSERGRIYRIFPRGERPSSCLPIVTVTAESLDTSNGVQRDLVHAAFLQRSDSHAGESDQQLAELRRIARNGISPAARVQALCVLSGVRGVTSELLRDCLRDVHPQIRRHAIRLGAGMVAADAELAGELLALATDPDENVRFQLASTLSVLEHPEAASAWASIADADAADPYVRLALLDAAVSRLDAAVEALPPDRIASAAMAPLTADLLQLAVAQKGTRVLTSILRAITSDVDETSWVGSLRILSSLLDALGQKKKTLAMLRDDADPELRDAIDRLDQLLNFARRAAADARMPLTQRMAAIAVLGRGHKDVEGDLDLLRGMLGAQHAPLIQLAASRSLLQSDSPRVTQMLLSDWKQLSPGLRSSISDRLASRRESAGALLDAVASGLVAVTDIDAATRNRLAQFPDEPLRAQAAKLFGNQASTSRLDVVEAYRSVLITQGDALRGELLYRKICAGCHQPGVDGQAIGPDLYTLTDRTPETFLYAVLDPNRSVDSRFVSYIASTDDGRVLTGLLREETSTSIRLIAQDGKEHLIDRETLEEFASSGKSLMPEGLEKDLSPQQLADVIAYLRAAGRPAGHILAGNDPQVVNVTRRGAIRLSPTQCEVQGPTLQMTPRQVLAGWSAECQALWTLEVVDFGQYVVWLEWLCPESSASGAMLTAEFTAMAADSTATPPSIRHAITPTGPTYREARTATVGLTPGRWRLSVQLADAAPSLELRSLTLIPAAGQVP